ncbi:unnamed protein product [Didymodactylos carnosus]|uniref:NAD(P)(+)--arginine ADP-ribosyltransferase n=1 Tax=Didymodactylos carnosus TaxID=1234261 RepID=A0A814AYR3_9BILA|nr:unnamed protein product [Didymodactylos carnosus]CAF3698397.1 unnamed protein product [Didymodactylos carnosus]
MSLKYCDIESINYSPVADSYKYSPLVSLETAITPVTEFIDNGSNNVRIANQRCKISSVMTKDESAAIYLYTMETNNTRSIYRVLNQALRSRVSASILPWYLYLKLLTTALNKLPSVKTSVWRGVPGNISKDYRKYTKLTWWCVTSCSASVNVIENFLQGHTHSTLFMIECSRGKAVSAYSSFSSEDEIILLPGTSLTVVAEPLTHAGIHIVHLREIEQARYAKSASFNPLPSFTKQATFYGSGGNNQSQIDLKFTDCSLAKSNTTLIKSSSTVVNTVKPKKSK